MDRIGEACGIIKSADHQAAGSHAITLELDAIKKKTVGDAAASEDNVFTGGQLVSLIDLVRIGDSHFSQAGQIALTGQAFPLLGHCHSGVVDQLALEVTTKSTQSRGRDHTLRRCADAHQTVSASACKATGDRSLDITI